MSIKTLYSSVTGGINVINMEVTESYGQSTSRCSIVTDDYKSLSLGDAIEIDMGFSDSHGKVFEGFIQTISAERTPGQYKIEANDVLIKAVEHLIFSTDLENPFRRWNIPMEDLVEDLLGEAGITSYSGDTSTFTLATGEVPAEFQLVFAMDAINQVAGIIAWHCYADHNGTVHFSDIKAAPSGGAALLPLYAQKGLSLIVRLWYIL